MSYLHIPNLYKDPMILMFKECYALEKIHGTSAHVRWKDGAISMFSGGASHEQFCLLFDAQSLFTKFYELGCDDVIVYGEAYGGKLQGMNKTYGTDLKFIVFDVKIGDMWLDVPDAQAVTLKLGLEFVSYVRIEAVLSRIDEERNKISVQAIRNNMCTTAYNQYREGIVLRPIHECFKKNGNRIIAKHSNAMSIRQHLQLLQWHPGRLGFPEFICYL